MGEAWTLIINKLKYGKQTNHRWVTTTLIVNKLTNKNLYLSVNMFNIFYVSTPI